MISASLTFALPDLSIGIVSWADIGRGFQRCDRCICLAGSDDRFDWLRFEEATVGRAGG